MYLWQQQHTKTMSNHINESINRNRIYTNHFAHNLIVLEVYAANILGFVVDRIGIEIPSKGIWPLLSWRQTHFDWFYYFDWSFCSHNDQFILVPVEQACVVEQTLQFPIRSNEIRRNRRAKKTHTRWWFEVNTSREKHLNSAKSEWNIWAKTTTTTTTRAKNRYEFVISIIINRWDTRLLHHKTFLLCSEFEKNGLWIYHHFLIIQIFILDEKKSSSNNNENVYGKEKNKTCHLIFQSK